MTTPEFVDLPDDGRSKYPAMLDAIQEAGTDKWAVLATFDKAPSARDTARRLKKEHGTFEFTSRLNDDGISGTVYARYVG